MKWTVEPTICQGRITGHLVVPIETEDWFPDADITIEIHNSSAENTLDLANHVCNLLNFQNAIDITQQVLGEETPS